MGYKALAFFSFAKGFACSGGLHFGTIDSVGLAVWEAGMTIAQIIGNALLFFGVLVMAGFIAFEINRWIELRKSDEPPRGLLNRTLRRSIGAFLLLVVLLLIKYPEESTLTQPQLFFKYLACLWLCLMVFLIALFDMRSIRAELRHELRKDFKKTTQDLENIVNEMTRQKEDEKKDASESDVNTSNAEPHS